MKADNEISLVLGGGGAKGAYQIGVLKAMAEYRLLDNVASVTGTSAGGLNAIMLTGMNCDDIYETVLKMEQIWRSFDIGDFVGVSKEYKQIIPALEEYEYELSEVLRFFYGTRQTLTNILFFDGGVFEQRQLIQLIDENY